MKPGRSDKQKERKGPGVLIYNGLAERERKSEMKRARGSGPVDVARARSALYIATPKLLRVKTRWNGR